MRRRIRAGALPAVKLPGPSGAFLVAEAHLLLIRRDPRGMASWRANRALTPRVPSLDRPHQGPGTRK